MRQFAGLGVVALVGVLFSLLVPLAMTAEGMRAPILGLGLQLLGWAVTLAVLLGRRLLARDQARLRRETEQLNRSVALYREALEGSRPPAPATEVVPPGPGHPNDDQIGALVNRIDDLLVAFRAPTMGHAAGYGEEREKGVRASSKAAAGNRVPSV